VDEEVDDGGVGFTDGVFDAVGGFVAGADKRFRARRSAAKVAAEPVLPVEESRA